MKDQIDNNDLETRIKADSPIEGTVHFLKRMLITNKYVFPKIVIKAAGRSIQRMNEIVHKFERDV
jgi:hypothetical protein